VLLGELGKALRAGALVAVVDIENQKPLGINADVECEGFAT